MNDLIRSIEQVRDVAARIPGAPNVSDFVLKRGKVYEYATLPSEYRMMTPQYCFSNSWTLAISRRLIYVEGYASVKGLPLPIAHAWCVKPGETKVIDPTTTDLEHYFGVAFNPKFVDDTLRRQLKDPQHESVVPIIDDWRHEWPLLQLTDEELRRVLYQEPTHGQEERQAGSGPEVRHRRRGGRIPRDL